MLKALVSIIFSLGLFINALLFVPQAIRLLKLKSSTDLSLITFIGFLITQLAAILYGYYQHDKILLYGYLLSLISCGFVTYLIIYYRWFKTKHG